jgi:DNA-binding protein YbaB
MREARDDISHALITHDFGTYEELVSAAVREAMAQMRTSLIERAMALSSIHASSCSRR